VSDHYATDGVAEELARLIRRLGSGARLMPERELAAYLGVSRTALRDRLQLMEGLGVLKRVVGSGTYIQELNPTGLALGLDLALTSSQLPLGALHSVRVALERQAAMEAVDQTDPVLIAHMRKALDTIAAAPDDQAVDDADFHFHVTLLRASGNPALAFFADALSGVLHEALAERRAEMRRLAGDHEIMIRLHNTIYEAVQSGDRAAAAAAVDEHFETFDHLCADWAEPASETAPEPPQARSPEPVRSRP